MKIDKLPKPIVVYPRANCGVHQTSSRIAVVSFGAFMAMRFCQTDHPASNSKQAFSEMISSLVKCFVWFVAAGSLMLEPGFTREFDFRSLDALVEQELKREACPGAALAIVHQGQTVYTQGYGFANIDRRDPVTADMLFRIGSTTKMFTAAALLTLVEQGTLDLHAPVGTYLPELSPALARVTTHQLLTHTSGLADPQAMIGPHDEAALAARVARISAADFMDEPGVIYSYSNCGYWTAGLVAERLSSQSYASCLHDRIFVPLSMPRTTFSPFTAMTWPLAVGHGPESRAAPFVIRPLADNAATWPAGQLFTSVHEYARFCIALMAGGKLENRQVLSAFVVDQLFQPRVPIPNEDRRYGYGLSVRDVQGERWFSHSGSRTGYGSHCRMCPHQQFAVIILCNKTGISLTSVADAAANLVLGVETSDKPPPVETLVMDEDEIDRYVGTYRSGQAKLVIEKREGKVFLSRNRLIEKRGEGIFLATASRDAPSLSFSLVFDTSMQPSHLMTRGRAYRRVD